MHNLNTHWNLSMCRCVARLSGLRFEPTNLSDSTGFRPARTYR